MFLLISNTLPCYLLGNLECFRFWGKFSNFILVIAGSPTRHTSTQSENGQVVAQEAAATIRITCQWFVNDFILQGLYSAAVRHN